MNLQKRCKCENPDRCEHPYYDRKMTDGKRIWIPLDTSSKTLAKERAEAKGRQRYDEEHGEATPERVRLSAWVATYLKHAEVDHELTALVEGKDRRVLASLEQFFKEQGGDPWLHQVTKVQLDGWRTWRLAAPIVLRSKTLLRPRSKTTVNREFNIVKGCFYYAVTPDVLRKSPAAGIAPWPAKGKAREVIPTTQYANLDAMPLVPRLLVQLTMANTLRLGALIRLEGKHLSWAGSEEHPAVYAVRMKTAAGEVTDRSEWVPVTEAQHAALRSLVKTPTQTYVFGDHDWRLQRADEPGTAYAAYLRIFWRNRIRRFSRLVALAMKRAGISGSHHSARHTALTNLDNAGTPTGDMMKLSGHTTARMINERYSHRTLASARLAVERNAAVVAAAMPKRRRRA
jgi:Phage integrase family